MKSVSSVKTHKAILEYLKVVPLPPGDKVCKWYMDNLSKEVRQLDLDCLFLHADEAVYSKLMMIKWLNEGLRIMKILENLTLGDTLTALIGKLRVDSSPALAESAIVHPNFCNIRSAITATCGTLSSMFVNNLKDISALLAMIRVVRECNIEMHLETKRVLLPQPFAFVHRN